jgi:hypothetical protein
VDFDELQRRARTVAGNLAMNRLDQRTLAHAAGAPEQRIVGRQSFGEARGVLQQRIAHPVDALEQPERQAINFGDGQEGRRLRLPDKGLGLVKIGLLRRWRGEPFQGSRDAFDKPANRFLEVHGNFV